MTLRIKELRESYENMEELLKCVEDENWEEEIQRGIHEKEEKKRSNRQRIDTLRGRRGSLKSEKERDALDAEVLEFQRKQSALDKDTEYLNNFTKEKNKQEEIDRFALYRSSLNAVKELDIINEKLTKLQSEQKRISENGGIEKIKTEIQKTKSQITDLESSLEPVIHTLEFLNACESRLKKFLQDAQLRRLNPVNKSERVKIIKELNEFSLKHHSSLFNDFCRTVQITRFPPRIIHTLIPAAEFQNRPELEFLKDWWIDEGYNGVLALVGLGGAGKTALVEKFISLIPNTNTTTIIQENATLPIPDMLFVWSFYDEPSSETFINSLFAYLNEKSSGVTSHGNTVHQIQKLLEENPQLRLLVVLDGLERVQLDDVKDNLGELQDKPLQQLLRRLAIGLGNARAIITSRYLIPDLAEWKNIGYQELNLDELPEDSAISILKNRKVRGSDITIKKLVHEFGLHALTLNHLAQAIVLLLNGDATRVNEISDLSYNPDKYPEKQAQRLARIFSFYEKKLPLAELDILRILSSFRFPITLATIQELLLKKKGRRTIGNVKLLDSFTLSSTLSSLAKRMLIYAETAGGNQRFITHPAVRDYFYYRLANPETIHQNVVIVLTRSVPETVVTHNSNTLDLLQELIYHSVHSGDTKNAFSIFLNKMGGYQEIGEKLGSFQRGDDILKLFTPPNQPRPGTPRGLNEEQLKEYYLQQSLFAAELGNLPLAVSSLKAHIRLRRRTSILEGLKPSDAYLQLFNYHVLLGELGAAKQAFIDLFKEYKNKKIFEERKKIANTESQLSHSFEPVERFGRERREAEQSIDSIWQVIYDLMCEKISTFIMQSKSENAITPIVPGESWWSLYGNLWHVSIYLRKDPAKAADLIVKNEEKIKNLDWNKHSSRWRIELAYAYMSCNQFTEAEKLLTQCLNWGDKTSNQEIFACSQIGFAKLHLLQNRYNAAEKARERGWLVAEECGFKLQIIELLNIAGELNLKQNKPAEAILYARDAYAMASNPKCNFVWGMADALKIQGKALLSMQKTTEAKIFFSKYLELGMRIKDAQIIDVQALLGKL